MGWLFLSTAVVVLLAVWVTWTAHRVDRLDERVRLARAALDVQLVRRAATAQAMADGGPDLDPALRADLRAAAHHALDGPAAGRETAENDLGRLLARVDAPPPELGEAGRRVAMARRFHNDAVRDLRDLRDRRLPRLFRLGVGRPLPAFFEIDDQDSRRPV